MAISMLATMVADLDDEDMDSMTVAELSFDESPDEHGVSPDDPMYVVFKDMSGRLNDLLTVREGAVERRRRLLRCRDVLTNAFKGT
ncbi:hypothetical protein CCR97_07940 [Rhodoplanes elegans]|uniref:Uncharacterized protein n=1 Tax=Rhodoplanes elegans TaxID=29408 RepID=A0A327KYD5_9BRAD|nr:hypothetical protein [Rhodoplanes elegans]MBK5958049.1 hypothetical protein [Rhodoplanes elegans]MBK5958141.1 hypothetical protein [Rhodoplanes elegans]RAI40428.1 hypothetical protein CH338_06190 [Rhodoplanes elegans]